jgi:hypothetical protein
MQQGLHLLVDQGGRVGGDVLFRLCSPPELVGAGRLGSKALRQAITAPAGLGLGGNRRLRTRRCAAAPENRWDGPIAKPVVWASAATLLAAAQKQWLCRVRRLGSGLRWVWRRWHCPSGLGWAGSSRAGCSPSGNSARRFRSFGPKGRGLQGIGTHALLRRMGMGTPGQLLPRAAARGCVSVHVGSLTLTTCNAKVGREQGRQTCTVPAKGALPLASSQISRSHGSTNRCRYLWLRSCILRAASSPSTSCRIQPARIHTPARWRPSCMHAFVVGLDPSTYYCLLDIGGQQPGWVIAATGATTLSHSCTHSSSVNGAMHSWTCMSAAAAARACTGSTGPSQGRPGNYCGDGDLPAPPTHCL